MNKTLLKINAWILTIIGGISVVIATIILFLSLIQPIEPNSWDLLGKFIMLIWTAVVYVLEAPLLISGIGTLNYLKGKNTYKLVLTSNIIGIILYGIAIFVLIYLDILGLYRDFYSGFVDNERKIIISLLVAAIFVLPQIINSIILYKNKNNLKTFKPNKTVSILIVIVFTIALVLIGINQYKNIVIKDKKIEITESNTYTYSDFINELIQRDIYDPNKSYSINGPRDIHGLDSTNKYGYRFSPNPYPGSYELGYNSTRKFPFFIYDEYTTLIQKSRLKTYFKIDMEDWYITWDVYYVNGEIYAVADDESTLDSRGSTSLPIDKRSIVVSESDEITIFNAKNNYYVKGGCITDTRSGEARSAYPTTSDIKNNKCINVRKVKRVDSKTLDSIAKEISKK